MYKSLADSGSIAELRRLPVLEFFALWRIFELESEALKASQKPS